MDGLTEKEQIKQGNALLDVYFDAIGLSQKSDHSKDGSLTIDGMRRRIEYFFPKKDDKE